MRVNDVVEKKQNVLAYGESKKGGNPNAHRLAYGVAVFFACGLAYFAILEAFIAIPDFNIGTQIRPASGVGPALSLFFGPPAILGCAITNIISDAIHGTTDPFTLFQYLLIQIAFNGVPYLLWYLFFRKSENPYPRLDSAGKIAAYMVIMIIDAIMVTIMIMPFLQDVMADFNADVIHVLNNFLFLMYVGMPLLVILNRTRLHPLPPPFIKAPFKQYSHMNLTQRVALIAVFGAAALILVCGVLGYGLYSVVIRGVSDVALVADWIYAIATTMTLVVFLPLVPLLHYLETRFTRPLEVLTGASREFVDLVRVHESSDQELQVEAVDLKGSKPRFEVRDLIEATNAMRGDVVDYIDRFAAATAEKERVEAELDVARQIQMNAVPQDFVAFTTRFQLDIFGMMRAAKEVGGDFYDVFDVGERSVGFVIGDVSGKGVPAALFMMRAQTTLKEHMRFYADLGEAFTLANRKLCEHNESLLFVTAFACVLDTETGMVSYVNAGHNAPWIAHAGRQEWLPSKPGLVLGAMDIVSYKSAEIQLEPGDGILLYTDGVTEATDAALELFGDDRLQRAFEDAEGLSVEKTVERIVAEVDDFAEGTPQADDITMLGFTWRLPVSSLALPPVDTSLDELFAFIKPFCEGPGRTGRMYFDLMLICEEVFVNIAHYGFPEGQPEQPVDIEAALDEGKERLYVTISDAGIAYNPLSFQPEKVGLGKDNRIGGLGILLVKERADEVRYERADGRNVLHIMKKFI